MQPSIRPTFDCARHQAYLMEEVMIAVRRLWFGAQVVPIGGAVRVVESGGELLMQIAEDSPAADRLIAGAAARGAFVVVTDHSQPEDLGSRLRLAGFSPVQSHSTYVLDPAAYDRLAAAERDAERRPPGLFSAFFGRSSTQVTIETIAEAELPAWNAVCWRAFGSRHSEQVSLLDKQSAMRNMGAAGRWYLASVGGRPAGTAILYQDGQAAQILAVGTLPSLRGRGVASALVRHVVAEWRRHGHGFLFLDTTPGTPAERLYLKLGFVRSYLREVYAPPPLA